MKKKAIIITFHCVDNYGAVFQCQALEEKLKNYFDDVEILDYRPEYLIKDGKCINTYSFKSVIMSLYSLVPFLKKKIGFRKYRNKYLNATQKKYKTASEITDENADCIFVGSDQIWNVDITNGFDDVYFGNFPSSGDAKVISYAASFGKEILNEPEKKELFKKLSNLSYISVREAEAAAMLKEKIDDVELVVDPTLLISEDYWRDAIEKKSSDTKYVLIYNLTNSPELLHMAKSISDKTGAEIIEICGKRKGLNNKTHKVLYSASPSEFLNYMANAYYVVTDSFHGTAFSIIFKKNFYVVPHKTRGGRMKTLLSELGIEKRICVNVKDDFEKQSINYDDVYEKLYAMRRKSDEFIVKSIGRQKKDERI